eukprot:scaffold2862_cov272-Pinguiococcus_pyrenoidosus.AAC.12
MRMVCTYKLEQENEMRTNFLTGIQREEGEIQQLVQQLREDLDVRRIEQARSENLTVQSTILETYADELREKRDTISDQLQQLKTRGKQKGRLFAC